MAARKPDIFRQKRQQNARLWRELAKQPAGDLVGVVRPGGVSGGQARGEKQWTLQIRLIAWRINGGPVSRKDLVVRKKCGERLVVQMLDSIGDYDVLRMRARVAVDNEMGSPQAQLVRLLGKASDPEMLAAAGGLKKKVVLKHRALGTLRLDRASGDFNGNAKWRDRRVRLSLEVDGRGSPDAAADHARILIGAQREWAPRVERRIVASLFPHWVKTWKLDEDKPLNEAQFLKKLKPTSIAMDPTGSFSVWYDDGDLFGGHAVEVTGRLRDGVKHADLAG
jgi:hypothetical protein